MQSSRFRTALFRLAFAGLLGMTPSPASSQNVIDQQHVSASGGVMGVVPGLSGWYGQTFQSGASNLSGAGFLLFHRDFVELDYPITITLWDGHPLRGGNFLTGGNGAIAIGGLASEWADVFWTPISIVSGRTYFLTLSSPGPDGYNLFAKPGGPYPSGQAYGYDGAVEYDDADGDLAFRTYTDLGAGSPSEVVPEPATMTLLATGLAGMAAARRKRRTVGFTR